MNIEKALREQYGPLERYVKFRIGNLQDAEDVVQDVMLTAFHRAEQLRNPDRFRPWLFQIAANACRDYYRSRKQPTENLEEVEQQLTEPTRPETAVEETLSALRERDQTILRLSYLEDRNQQEIAAAMGIPVGTVKSRLHWRRFNRDDWAVQHFGQRWSEKLPENEQLMVDDTLYVHWYDCITDYIL